MMERNRNPATIRMAVTLMAASLRAQKKLISDKSRDESSGRQAAKSAIIIDNQRAERHHLIPVVNCRDTVTIILSALLHSYASLPIRRIFRLASLSFPASFS